ncbi:hypothetical protein HK097_008954 [Rhizophlyctis rosea]|uniref:C2H2-type domain-containing protein n=1 Tax=Rhizophlyctis rosea TaxID=64517 RepID=A0AAD5SJ91_9FUNG|nr:hypothetical protein HK097_008954 [Rhizophlyctis rosea]
MTSYESYEYQTDLPSLEQPFSEFIPYSVPSSPSGTTSTDFEDEQTFYAPKLESYFFDSKVDTFGRDEHLTAPTSSYCPSPYSSAYEPRSPVTPQMAPMPVSAVPLRQTMGARQSAETYGYDYSQPCNDWQCDQSCRQNPSYATYDDMYAQNGYDYPADNYDQYYPESSSHSETYNSAYPEQYPSYEPLSPPASPSTSISSHSTYTPRPNESSQSYFPASSHNWSTSNAHQIIRPRSLPPPLQRPIYTNNTYNEPSSPALPSPTASDSSTSTYQYPTITQPSSYVFVPVDPTHPQPPISSLPTEPEEDPSLPPGSGKFQCPIPGCGKLFQKKCGLASHRKSHKPSSSSSSSSSSPPIPQLQISPAAFYEQALHKTQPPALDRLHGCEICKKTFLRRQDLRRHRATHFDAGARFRCDNCDTTFSRSDAL